MDSMKLYVTQEAFWFMIMKVLLRLDRNYNKLFPINLSELLSLS